jgi:hypothetical protein
LKISFPLSATTSRGSVQQGLSVAGGALGLFQLGLATGKRYVLNIKCTHWRRTRHNYVLGNHLLSTFSSDRFRGKMAISSAFGGGNENCTRALSVVAWKAQIANLALLVSMFNLPLHRTAPLATHQELPYDAAAVEEATSLGTGVLVMKRSPPLNMAVNLVAFDVRSPLR